jgi:hypothetical protein
MKTIYQPTEEELVNMGFFRIVKQLHKEKYDFWSHKDNFIEYTD